MNEFRIDAQQQRSLVLRNRLALSAEGWCRFTVEISDPNCNALVEVHCDPKLFGSLGNYFDDIAHAWKGWKGIKKWENFDDPGFSLKTTSDALGHAQMRAMLWRDGAWVTEITFELNTVDFNGFAKAVKKFFSEG